MELDIDESGSRELSVRGPMMHLLERLDTPIMSVGSDAYPRETPWIVIDPRLAFCTLQRVATDVYL
jgi:hypothetical protein